MLAKLWSARTAPGVLAPVAHPPLGVAPKGKLYPAMVTALAAESLARWREHAPPDAGAEPVAPEATSVALAASGLLVHHAGDFVVAAGRGPNLLEARAGGAVLEAARILVHAVGWNPLFVAAQDLDGGALGLELSSAPGHDHVRLPQFHRARPGERAPGNAVPVTRGRWTVRVGPGATARAELVLDGAPGANALLELGARPDQLLFDGDGRPLAPPVSLAASGTTVLAGAGSGRLVLRHRGGSGHALQVERYGYGDGDALWAPSYAPKAIRIGCTLPARVELELEPG
jgi:hypothetical protein